MSSAYAAGEIISNYRLDRLIGMGGFGEVWLAEHVDLNTEVAIKIPTLLEYVKQLRAEGRIQYDLDHENIVKIIDLNTTNDPPYCIMEFVDGENLRQKLEREVLVSESRALDIIRQVLLAVHEAHGRGIVHRDLKPENVLLDLEGGIQVADFGLGTVGDEVTRSILLSTHRTTGEDSLYHSSDSPSVSTGSIVRSDSMGAELNPAIAGTYDYMSPEQRTGERVDARSDIYAVGVMLFEMLTGGRPSGNIEATLESNKIPDYLSESILTALDEYDYRHESAADFLRALRMDRALRKPKRAGGNDAALDEYLKTVNIRMKAIDGGTFMMGADDGPDNERPAHEVDISSFFMGIYPVTAAEYSLFLNEVGDPKNSFIRLGKQTTFERVGSGFKPVAGCEDYPANFISWHGANAFCEWLSELTGQEYLLPTEEQWEFVARGGDLQNPYPWGIQEPTKSLACFGQPWKSPKETLCPVDGFNPNDLGISSMGGSIWEWCREPFFGDYERTAKMKNVSDELANGSHNFHVVRGGCWSSPVGELLCSFRNVQSKGARTAGIGFRICRKS